MAQTEPNRRLAPENAQGDDISRAWASDNQQWWNWYMSLAVNDGGAPEALQPAAPLPQMTSPSPGELSAQLDAPYAVTEAQAAAFRRDGFVKIPAMLEPAGLLGLRTELEQLLKHKVAGADGLAFPSLEMVWQYHAMTRAYVFSQRLAKAAADLLGVSAVRLYHDNVLSKNPGCGRTPWHYDAHHYPIASEAVVTLWLPLQSTPRAMGPLAFARDMDAWKLVADLPFAKGDDSYDRGIASALREAAVPIEAGPFALGEASFHHTRCLHTAGPNQTDGDRMAFATTYLADGARVVDRPTLVSGDYQKFMPGVGPGDPIASSLNPLIEAPEER